MTDIRISALSELTVVEGDDYVVIVEKSDTIQSPAGTTKKIKVSNLLNLSGSVVGKKFNLTNVVTPSIIHNLGSPPVCFVQDAATNLPIAIDPIINTNTNTTFDFTNPFIASFDLTIIMIVVN